MLGALASADAVTWLSIVLKALAYAATLLAAGSVLAGWALHRLSAEGRAALHRLALASALAAAVLSVLRLPVQASFLMGGTWAGAVDPAMLALVAGGPLGTSLALRIGGLALIACVALPLRAGRWLALAGAVAAAASFAARGHALEDPRWLLAPLVTVHILGLSFWLGGLIPLARAARRDPAAQAGALAQDFGKMALFVVAALAAAGGMTLVALGVATPAALAAPYGQMILVKLGLFAAVLALAARNRFVLTPALLAGAPRAAIRLRRTIAVEALVIAAILVTTAALTTLAAPPGWP